MKRKCLESKIDFKAWMVRFVNNVLVCHLEGFVCACSPSILETNLLLMNL